MSQPVGLCGVLMMTGSRVGPKESDQRVYIQGPSPVFPGLPEGQVASHAFGHFVQGLIAGPVNDHMISGGQRCLHEQEDGLFGTAVHQHLIRCDGVVKPADGLPE
jgi:hypothetical protein